MYKTILLMTLLGAGLLSAAPVKVYVLSGQSNMEGHANVSTIDYVGEDPKTAPMYREMKGEDGKFRVCDDVWVSYFTGNRGGNGEGLGKLSVGFGSRSNPSEPSEKIGPEYTFGIYMDKATAEPIVLIKTAWGGKSLHTDFRPPSAGPYPFSDKQIETLTKQGKWPAAKKAKEEATGHYYRLMIDHVKMVLADLKRVYPEYDAKDGYELAGFAWFQGWNDLVAGDVYPDRGAPGSYDAYSDCMAHFIRDVRKDLKAPNMKFVIGVLGVNGPLEKVSPRYRNIYGEFRKAMAAPASYPEFKGNVAAVETAPYWDLAITAVEEKLNQVNQFKRGLETKHKDYPNKDGKMSKQDQQKEVEKLKRKLVSQEDESLLQRAKSNGGYHYNGSAKTIGQIGKAFAEAMLEMEGR